LSVYIDQKLTFKSHTEKAISKATTSLGILFQLRHKGRGITFVMARHLVLTLLLLQLLYASPVWWTEHLTLQTRLEKMYNQMLRWATRLGIFPPLCSLYRMARMPPIPCILDLKSPQYGIRLLFVGPINPLH